MTRLRDLGEWSGGNTPSKANAAYWTDGTIPWVSPKDMKVDEITSSEDRVSEVALREGRVSLLPEGAVLIVTRSGILSHTLPVAVTKTPVTINQDLKALTPKQGVLPRYVAHALRGASRRILKECSKHGTTVASVETNALLDFEIPLVDLDDQGRIVAELEKQFSRLDEAVANLKRVKANLKRYTAAVVEDAVAGRLLFVESDRARRQACRSESASALVTRLVESRRSQWRSKAKYKEPPFADRTDAAELPPGWAVATVEQVAFVEVGNAFKSSEFAESGIRLLRGENIEPGRLRWAETRYWPHEKVQPFRALLIEDGDIILAMDRPIISSGLKLARARKADLPCLLVQRVARLRCVDRSIADYLHIAMSTEAFKRHLVGGQTGTQLPHVSGASIGAFRFPLPALTEQRRIVAEVDRRLSIVREVEAEVDANLKRTQALRQAVLARAFSVGREHD